MHATTLLLIAFAVAQLVVPSCGQIVFGASFQTNKTVTVVQEGVSFDMLTYQDSPQAKAASISRTANGYQSQYTYVDTTTNQSTVYYTYEAFGEVICYRYLGGTVPWPFPITRPVAMAYRKEALYNGVLMDVFQQNVGRYTRRLFTNVNSVAPGAPFQAILPNMEAMSMQIEAIVVNNTDTNPAYFNVPAACLDERRVRVLRSPAANAVVRPPSPLDALHGTVSAHSTVPPHVKFNVRDPSNVAEEFELLISEVGEAMRRQGRTLAAYSPLPSLVSRGGSWTGPTSVDNRAYATAVRDQGMCGACWAFSSVATTEVVYNKLHNITYGVGTSANWLSPQNMIDCAIGDLNGTALFPSKGCFGGWPLVALFYIVSEGIVSEAAYPFDSANGRQCLQSTVGVSQFPLSNAMYISYSNGPVTNLPYLMAAVVSEGAVTAILNADPTLFYPGGIFNDPGCISTMGHAVTLIGFGTDEASGIDYWLVKNSFGAAWGEGGFFRIIRGVNMCGIEQMGFVAIAK